MTTPTIPLLAATLAALGCGRTASLSPRDAPAATAPDLPGPAPDSAPATPHLAAADTAGAPAPASDAAPPPDAPAGPSTPPATLSPESLSWGTVGPGALGPQPAWVVGFVRLETLRPLAGLRLERVRLLDAGGNVLAETVSEHEIRVASAENVPGDLSTYGTTPLEGDLPAGARLRLRLHGRLDRSFDDLCPRLCSPSRGERFEAVLRTAAGEELRVEGPLSGAWPTA